MINLNIPPQAVPLAEPATGLPAMTWYRFFSTLLTDVRYIGLYSSASVALASAVALTSATPTNVTSLQLPSGDWDVYGSVYFSPAGGTIISAESAGVNTTSATLPVAPAGGMATIAGVTQAAGTAIPLTLGYVRLNLALATRVYLVVQASFTVSTCGAYGALQARRIGNAV